MTHHDKKRSKPDTVSVNSRTRANIVQGLWIGSSLSQMELACIQSYLNQGHEFHLYGYEKFKNLPKGALWKNANQIIPQSQVFTIQQGGVKGSYAGFADLFRYKLLHSAGGWWTDMDFLCFNPLPKPEGLYVACEWNPRHIRRGSKRQMLVDANRLLRQMQSNTTSLALKGWSINWLTKVLFSTSPTCSLMFSHPGDEIMKKALKIAEEKVENGLKQWGEIGPALIAQLLREETTISFQLGKASLFMPISYSQVPMLFDAFEGINVRAITTIHLYNEVWRQKGFSKDSPVPPSSLLQLLLDKAGIKLKP